MQQETALLGLSQKEAAENISLYSKNILAEKKKSGVIFIFLRQFRSPFIFILIFVASVSLFFKEFTDAIVIFSVLIINAFVGTLQEHRANNAVSALKKLSQPKTKVVRDGTLTSIHTTDVTVGDLVYLEAGDVVPADGVLVEGNHIGINESAINGESLPVIKEGQDTALYKSTIVASGSGFMHVEKIGPSTLIGGLAQDLNKNENKSFELQKKLSSFSFKLLITLGVSSFIFLIISLFRDVSFITSLKTVAALGVAVIPEGLPIVITVVLSIGALHISKARALLRNLPSGATLASVSTICTDKTGTLTYGDVSVKEIVYIGDSRISEEEKKSFIHHSLDIKNIAGKKSGDILELVLDNYIQGTFTLEETKELPFTSENKYNAKEFLYNDSFLQIYKGAGEVFGVDQHLMESYTKDGYRVLFVGYKILANKEDFTTTNVNPLALIVFEDKIREDVKDSIAKCKKTGINIIMMTGDNILTAKHVAREVGILESGHDLCLVGKDIEDMDDEELKEKLSSIKVIARVSPAHKERVVALLQEKGEIVAMTGDGVNDGPALSLANIGISMGKSGTEVAREASDLVLIHDDFSDIVLAIFEARTITENIRKALVFLMTSATGILILTLGAVISGNILPLLPVQILWLNFVTAGFLDVAIATEEPEKKYATYTFKRYQGGLLNRYDALRILASGIALSGVTLYILSAFQNKLSVEELRTAIIIVFSVGIWLHAFNVRKNYDVLTTYPLFSNKFIVGAIFIEMILLGISVYTSLGNTLLHTRPLMMSTLTVLLLAGLVVLVSDYLYKKFASKRHV